MNDDNVTKFPGNKRPVPPPADEEDAGVEKALAASDGQTRGKFSSRRRLRMAARYFG